MENSVIIKMLTWLEPVETSKSRFTVNMKYVKTALNSFSVSEEVERRRNNETRAKKQDLVGGVAEKGMQ